MVLSGRCVLSCQKAFKGFAEGSTKVPPKFRQSCPSFVVSPVFLGQMRLEPHAVGDFLLSYSVNWL